MLSRLPLHNFPLLFANTSMRDRISLARTSRKLRAICARELQASINRVLRKFNLSHAEIRFMQTATMTLISGPLITHLMDDNFIPSHLDFYTPNGNFSAVMQFFHLATLYEETSTTHENGSVGGQSMATLSRPYSGKYIHVIQSRTDSAMDCIPYSPFSHLFGSISHYGVWLGYPRTMTTGISFFNRDSIDVEKPLMRYHLTLDLADYADRFRFCFSWGQLHTCGVDLECPATSRSTDDQGCLNIFFPNAPMGASQLGDVSSVYPTDSVMTWSLDGRRCPPPAGPVARMCNDRCAYFINSFPLLWLTRIQKTPAGSTKCCKL
jgi:hypothetical protein